MNNVNLVATNRKAKRDYDIVEAFEAGIELKGNEVKSLRMKNCSLENSFARIENGELFLYDMHIADFAKSSFFKTAPKRTRKLLIHKQHIRKLIGLTTQRSFTLIPLKVYFNERGIAKIGLALARGKRLFDKRRKIKEEIVERETQRTLKSARRKWG